MTNNLFPHSPPKLLLAIRFLFRQIANAIPPSSIKNFFLKLSGIRIGRKVFVGQNVTFIDGYIHGSITLEDNCVVSPRVVIVSLAYPNTSNLKFNDTLTKFSPIVIEKNAWVGTNACILPGGSIAQNSVLGAGSVLTKKIPSGEIWTGNAAKKIRDLKK